MHDGVEYDRKRFGRDGWVFAEGLSFAGLGERTQFGFGERLDVGERYARPGSCRC